MVGKLYDLMGRWAKKHFLDQKYRYGKKVPWTPSSIVIKDLVKKTGMDAGDIVEQLKKERREMLRDYGIK